MKNISLTPSRIFTRLNAAAILTSTILSAVLLGGVSATAQTFTNVSWIAPSAEDYSTASGWNLGFVPTGSSYGGPGGTNTYVILLTNGVACNYANPDNYSVGQISIAPWDNGLSGSFNLNSGTLTLNTNNNNYSLTIPGRSGAGGSGGSGESPSSGMNNTGTFTQNGGTLNVIRYGSGHYHQDAVFLGVPTNSTGTYNLNGGTFNCYAGIEIGGYGAGIFTINGGTLIDNGWFGVGRGNGVPFGSGTFNMESGTFYQMENTGGGTVGGSGALALDQGCTNAVVNVSGGSIYSGDIAFCATTMTPAPRNYFNMSGGTVYVGYGGVYSNNVAASNNFVTISGGTFHTVDMYPTGTGAPTNYEGSATNILSDGTNWTWGVNVNVNLTNSSFAVNGVTGPGYVTFAPESTRTITLNNIWFGVGGMTLSGPGTLALAGKNSFGGPLTVNGGTLALSAAQSDTGGLTVNAGNVAILNGGSVADSSISFPSGSSLIFTNSSALTFTNIVTGAGNVVVAGAGTVNVGNNLQNTGTITQNNGALVVNGTILNASSVTNNGPASVGPLAAQGTINSPIGIGPNSSLELGNTAAYGTLNASNLILNGSWILKINSANTPGGGTNDLLICTNLTLGASSILNIIPEGLPSGSYLIAEYSGSLNGTFGTVSNSTSSGSYVVSYATPGEIILNVSGVTPASLAWAALTGAANINWDVNTSSNWTNTATSALSTFHQQDAVTFSGTPGATPVTNRVSVAAQVLPSSITVNGGLPYIISGVGYISGGTGITYNDTNTSGIYTAGNNYTGPVYINNGVLQLGSGGSAWLGATNGTAYVNGGTLDLNAQGIGAKPLVIQGTGSAYAGANSGAINNSSTSSPGQSAGPLNITLAGNTTLNAASNRWDIGINTPGAGGGSFTGNGYNLTKIGQNAIWMHELGDIGVGNIDIQQGELGFQFTIGMGISSDTVTVEPGAEIGFYQLTNSVLNKQMVMNGNATMFSGGNSGSPTSNSFVGPITLNGTNAIQTTGFPLNLGGNITGTGGFVYTGPGPLYLGGADTYSGQTVIGSAGSIVLGATASIPNTSLIYLTPSTNTVLDASAPGSLTLGSGQTLVGAGDIKGNVTANPGSVISLGTNQLSTTAYGTIIFTNNLTLNGNTNYFKISDNNNIGIDNDLIYVNGNLNLSGTSTLIITPLAALNASQNYTIIQSGNIASGGTGNLKVISVSPRYTMTPVISGGNVQLSITGNSAPLEWEGYLTPNWDLSTSNWYNMGTAAHDHFYNEDDPTFDDTASVTAVVVTNNVLVVGMNMSNVVKNYTFSGGGVITGPLAIEGNGSGAGGTTVLAFSNAPAFTGIDSSAGTLVYNLVGLSNYTVAASITDSNGTGNSTIIFGGTNTVTLAGDQVPAPVLSFGYNPDFDGTIMVTNGILQYTNVNALGVDASFNSNPSFAPIIVTNNGTLNFNGVAVGAADAAAVGGEKWIHISGTGFNGQGALIDTKGNQEPNGAFCYLYLDTNATVNMLSNRCDQHVLSGNAQQINGNGYNLTFVGGGALFINAQSDGDTHLGNIDVACTNGGRLAFQGGPLALGITSDYLTVEPGGLVTFYNFSNALDTVNLGVQKNIWLKGNASIDSGGNAGSESNNFDCPIFLTGTNLIGTRFPMHVWGSIMDSNGPGGFILGNTTVGASSAKLWLDGTNTYSGQTIISNATVVVGTNSSLGFSKYVQVNSGATLDLSATPGYNFGTVQTNQTMAGNGTVIGPATGNLTFNAGGTLAVGLPTTNGIAQTNTFTLTMNNNVVFNAGSTNYIVANKTSPSAGAVPVDKVSGLGSLTLGGTLVITNFGTGYVAGDSLALFSATTIATNSTFSIVPATPGPNLLWNFSTFLTAGTLQVASSSTVNPNPTNITVQASGGQLILSWPADHIGWQLQAMTNSVRVGLSNNWVNFNPSTTVDSVMIPINLTNGTVFYRLVY